MGVVICNTKGELEHIHAGAFRSNHPIESEALALSWALNYITDEHEQRGDNRYLCYGDCKNLVVAVQQNRLRLFATLEDNRDGGSMRKATTTGTKHGTGTTGTKRSDTGSPQDGQLGKTNKSGVYRLPEFKFHATDEDTKAYKHTSVCSNTILMKGKTKAKHQTSKMGVRATEAMFNVVYSLGVKLISIYFDSN